VGVGESESKREREKVRERVSERERELDRAREERGCERERERESVGVKLFPSQLRLVCNSQSDCSSSPLHFFFMPEGKPRFKSM